MNTLMMHRIENVKFEKVRILEESGTYVLDIRIRQKGELFTISLFSDDKEIFEGLIIE